MKERHRRTVVVPAGLDNSLRRLARERSVEQDRDVSVTELIIEAAEQLVAEEQSKQVDSAPT